MGREEAGRILLVLGGVVSVVYGVMGLFPFVAMLALGIWHRGWGTLLAWQVVYGWFFLLVGALQLGSAWLAFEAARRAREDPRAAWRRGLLGGILGFQVLTLVGAFLCRRSRGGSAPS